MKSFGPAGISLPQRRFVLVDTPIFTPTACEGTTTLFETDYFGDRKAYLTQSGQLYLEAAALALGKVYCFGPTFRAEKSKTRRHLTEFWMLETEIAFAELDDILTLAEAFICFIMERVLANRRAELATLERPVAPLEAIRPPFPRLSYTEALERLAAGGHQISWGDDLGAPEETFLSESFDRPVLIHRYPKECKAFYMKPDPADPRTVLCVDVLAPEGVGEIIGGSQREDDLEALAGPHQRTPPPPGTPGMVPGPAPLRQRPPRWLRPGPGTPGGLDLRPAPCPGGHPLPTPDGSVGAVTPACTLVYESISAWGTLEFSVNYIGTGVVLVNAYHFMD